MSALEIEPAGESVARATQPGRTQSGLVPLLASATTDPTTDPTDPTDLTDLT